MPYRPDELPDLPPGVVVPDDARALADDLEMLRAERRAAAARTSPLGRLLFTRRWHRYGLSGPFVFLVLMVVAAFGSLVVVVLPDPGGAPTTLPLADPAVPPGRRGGLLPPAVLRDSGGGEVVLRDVRPAVVLLLPAACGCPARATELAEDLVDATLASLLPVVLVGDPAAPGRPARASQRRVRTVADPRGTVRGALVPAVPADQPTVVLVGADGRIERVVNPVDVTALQPALAALA